jgi:DNA helicase-2/ATP-dependent DNA helicase PcrA
LEQEAAMFDHLLIDEYQDTNGSQYRIVKALADQHRNLCVVGDDDQSIYGWRGAEVEHILRFTEDWPEATVVRLEDNYRSTSEIIALANRLIVFNAKRHDKVLKAARYGGERPRVLQFKDENAEAKEVVAEINLLIKRPELDPRDFAILFRTNEQTRAFETELRRAKLPYVLLGGMSFFDRKEVRDILAYFRVLESPQDEVSLLRILNNPPRGIGSKTIQTLMADAVANGKPVWDVMHSPGNLPTPARMAVERFVETIERFQGQIEQRSLVDSANALIKEINYEGELTRLYQDGEEKESRWDAVQEVVNALADYERRSKKSSLTGFLDDVALGGREMDGEKDKQLQKNAVVLMTMHSAKGLEFPHVYMVGLEEGILPHHRSLGGDEAAIDEERRLAYVGVTRAQDRLTLSLPLARMKWGKPRDTIPSRFLYEMTGQADNPQAIAQRQQAIRDAAAQRRRGSRRPIKKKSTRPAAGPKRPPRRK